MYDGGASNCVSKKMLADSLLKIRKHAKSPFELWYMTINTYFMYCLRKIVPNSYMKRYRYFKNKE